MCKNIYKFENNIIFFVNFSKWIWKLSLKSLHIHFFIIVEDVIRRDLRQGCFINLVLKYISGIGRSDYTKSTNKKYVQLAKSNIWKSLVIM